MADNKIISYPPFLEEILSKIQLARYEMLKTVSKQTVTLYWEIGKAVSQKVQQVKWGKSIVEQLSKDLQTEFPGIRGFSARNIWNMKGFYEFYTENEKLQPLVAEIGWTQNCLILEKCKDKLKIEYYLRKTKEMGWSKADLIDKINTNHFENQALAQNNFALTVSPELKAKVAWEFVDDYQVELINPDLPISEKELENAIVTNVVKFLSEMGGSFAFVGRQFKIDFHDKEYFIDLLFFNLKLNCYVVFELKAREFDPKDVGQIKWYMELINKEVKEPAHQPTIGIILCKNKDHLMVEYMLSNIQDPLGVATFNRYEELPEKYAKYLPSEQEIIKRLANLGAEK
ncbi:MAG: PDDEXK nuclease domain-containing protein [Chitinophagales bacterium]|jgi:predicted nuclease of restriction endonuclease-like (RecB) superfamily|nr:PDDEXK nuclease domain-containing protein [Chitinophagales bacterium]